MPEDRMREAEANYSLLKKRSVAMGIGGWLVTPTVTERAPAICSKHVVGRMFLLSLKDTTYPELDADFVKKPDNLRRISSSENTQETVHSYRISKQTNKQTKMTHCYKTVFRADVHEDGS